MVNRRAPKPNSAVHSEQTDSAKTRAATTSRRILLWSPWGAGLHYSGPGTNAYRLYRSAGDDRFQVTLVHGVTSHRTYPLYQQQICLAPIGPRRWRQIHFLYRSRRWLRDNASRFDVFHGLWGYEATVRPAAYAMKLGLPSVVKIAACHEDLADKPGWRSWLGQTRRRRRLLDNVGAVIAISQAIEQELLCYGVPADKIVRIPNGVDTQHFRPAENEAERDAIRQRFGIASRPTILFSGGVERRKRPHLVAAALTQLARERLDAQLLIAGPIKDTVYMRQIQARVESANLADRIHWLGMTEEIAALYRVADVFVLPSTKEGMANALLEAMASGVACVASDTSGVVDLIDDEQLGRVCTLSNNEETDVDSLTAAIRVYLTEPQVAARHGQAARQRIQQHFSTRVVLQQHEDLFHRLIHT